MKCISILKVLLHFFAVPFNLFVRQIFDMTLVGNIGPSIIML